MKIKPIQHTKIQRMNIYWNKDADSQLLDKNIYQIYQQVKNIKILCIQMNRIEQQYYYSFTMMLQKILLKSELCYFKCTQPYSNFVKIISQIETLPKVFISGNGCIFSYEITNIF